jgi:hypothetical protein
MPAIQNYELVQRISAATQEGQVDWQPTAQKQ